MRAKLRPGRYQEKDDQACDALPAPIRARLNHRPQARHPVDGLRLPAERAARHEQEPSLLPPIGDAQEILFYEPGITAEGFEVVADCDPVEGELSLGWLTGGDSGWLG